MVFALSRVYTCRAYFSIYLFMYVCILGIYVEHHDAGASIFSSCIPRCAQLGNP